MEALDYFSVGIGLLISALSLGIFAFIFEKERRLRRSEAEASAARIRQLESEAKASSARLQQLESSDAEASAARIQQPEGSDAEALATRIRQLESEAKISSTLIQQLESGDVHALAARIRELKSEAKTSSERVQQLEARLSSEAEASSAHIQQLESSDVQALAGRIRQLKSEAKTSSASIQQLERDAEASATRIRQLESETKTSSARIQQLESEAEASATAIQQLEAWKPITDLELETERLDSEFRQRQTEIDALRASYADKKAIYDQLIRQVAIFDEKLSFAEMGVYEPHFDFTDSEEYKKAIVAAREEQKEMISGNRAVWRVTSLGPDGTWPGRSPDLREAARDPAITDRRIRLALRALNNECDAAIANVRWSNVKTMEKRIKSAETQINKLNLSNGIFFHKDYIELKLQELYLTHEHREKLKTERDERAERARLAREEQKLIRDKEWAEEEEARYQRLLDKAKAEAQSIVGPQLDAFTDQIRMLEQDLAKAHEKVLRAQAMAEKTRSGYVYIISNVGSFGDGVVKIGLTRRLDPADRIRELGDASVPFIFDTHAVIYSDDAPALERAIHTEFEPTRVNAQNRRKEFFSKDIEAQDYRETLAKRSAALLMVETAAANAAFPDSL